jgi:hypothetical protein
MNAVPFEVTPLTEASYAEFRDELDRIAAHPETVFYLPEGAETTVVRSVLGALLCAGQEEPIAGLSEYELRIVYRIVLDASEGLAAPGGVAYIRLDRQGR